MILPFLTYLVTHAVARGLENAGYSHLRRAVRLTARFRLVEAISDCLVEAIVDCSDLHLCGERIVIDAVPEELASRIVDVGYDTLIVEPERKGLQIRSAAFNSHIIPVVSCELQVGLEVSWLPPSADVTQGGQLFIGAEGRFPTLMTLDGRLKRCHKCPAGFMSGPWMREGSALMTHPCPHYPEGPSSPDFMWAARMNGVLFTPPPDPEADKRRKWRPYDRSR